MLSNRHCCMSCMLCMKIQIFKFKGLLRTTALYVHRRPAIATAAFHACCMYTQFMEKKGLLLSLRYCKSCTHLREFVENSRHPDHRRVLGRSRIGTDDTCELCGH
mmetsp:Transcript_119540/g.230621  ORF Transcript_119540/g.230621 Transcript_119540/m.230621 type:complete len:105 (-) Transcript_119540:7-321(-)